jgi:hypothetical protein
LPSAKVTSLVMALLPGASGGRSGARGRADGKARRRAGVRPAAATACRAEPRPVRARPVAGGGAARWWSRYPRRRGRRALGPARGREADTGAPAAARRRGGRGGRATGAAGLAGGRRGRAPGEAGRPRTRGR